MDSARTDLRRRCEHTLRGAPVGPRKPEVKRNALIEAAIALVVHRKSDDVTIDDIVLKAGVSKGSFYNYFDSKEAILVALREHFTCHLLTVTQSKVEQCAADDWRGKLHAWVIALIEGTYAMQALHETLFHGKNENRDISITTYNVVRYLTELLSAGRAARAWVVEQPALMAALIFAAVHGLIDEAMRDAFTREEIERMGPELISNLLPPANLSGVE